MLIILQTDILGQWNPMLQKAEKCQITNRLQAATKGFQFLAHLSRRLIGELVVYRSSRRPSVRPCVRLLTLSNMNISATSWPIGMKFYLKHHWGGGKASVGFDPDRLELWFPWQQIAPIE